MSLSRLDCPADSRSRVEDLRLSTTTTPERILGEEVLSVSLADASESTTKKFPLIAGEGEVSKV